MSDLLKVRIGGGDYLCKWDPNFVVIGGRKYKTVKIGNQLWMAENLDFKPTGVRVGTNAWYYNNDEQTYGYRGLLYSWNGVSVVIDSNLLPSGWRVPAKVDFDNLVLTVGSDAAKKLKASSFGGTDDFGFSILNAGYHVYEGFGDEVTGFWTTSNYSSSAKDAPWFYNNSDSWSWAYITFTGVNAIPIRLVKDVT